MTDREKILAEIERLKKDWQCYLRYSVESKYRTEAYTELLDFINSLPEEPVNNSDWLLELQDKLDNATPEQLEELWNKYHDEEEPVSEDLEEAAEKYAYENWQSDDYHDGASEGLPFDAIGHTEKCFKAGSQWQKEQLMAKAVETTFNVSLSSGLYDKLLVKGCKNGDKLLVIKEDEL